MRATVDENNAMCWIPDLPFLSFSHFKILKQRDESSRCMIPSNPVKDSAMEILAQIGGGGWLGGMPCHLPSASSREEENKVSQPSSQGFRANSSHDKTGCAASRVARMHDMAREHGAQQVSSFNYFLGRLDTEAHRCYPFWQSCSCWRLEGADGRKSIDETLLATAVSALGARKWQGSQGGKNLCSLSRG